ncbi:MAG: penicillin-binding protein 1A [Verrucomicrobiales bacterium]|jgi:penicillin-binding protein 1A
MMIKAPWRTPEFRPSKGFGLFRLRTWFLRLGFLSGILALIAVGFYLRYAFLASKFDLNELGKMPERTQVFDAKGALIGRLHGMNREMIPLERSSRYFLDALLAREDNSFFNHRGVDFRGVARAVIRNIKDRDFVQGASTISMQLARNSYGMTERTLHRKLVEVMLTRRIEKSVAKNMILELYINRIFFGSGLYGLERASQAYFRRPSGALTLGQGACLAGIIRSPNRFSPFNNPEGAARERDTVLDRMVVLGYIKEDEAAKAKAADLEIKEEPSYLWQENYAMDFVRRYLNETWLRDQDYKEDGGLKVYTTIDQEVQLGSEQALRTRLDALEALPEYQHPTYAEFTGAWKEGDQRRTPYLQGSVVVLDNATGSVIALVGGRDYQQSKFNRALHAKRQVGSVFKPFVYAAAYEGRHLLPHTNVSDERVELHYEGVRPWHPRNSDGTYRGWQPAEYGLVASRNTMTARVGELAGLDKVSSLAYAANLADPKRGPLPESPVVYIGAFETPLLQVTSAYTALANGGVRPQWHVIRSIEDRGGERLDHVRTGYKQRLIQEGTAALVTQGLSAVMEKGTGASAKRLGWEWPAAGKTGTTDDYRDGWFMGYTSSLTCGVWVGLDNNAPVMPGGYGSKTALPIWVDVMKEAVENGYPAEGLNEGPHRAEVEVCKATGDLAALGCHDAGFAVIESIPEDLIDARVLCTEHDNFRGRQMADQSPPYSGSGQPQPSSQKRPPRWGVMDRIFSWLR